MAFSSILKKKIHNSFSAIVLSDYLELEFKSHSTKNQHLSLKKRALNKLFFVLKKRFRNKLFIQYQFRLLRSFLSILQSQTQ